MKKLIILRHAKAEGQSDTGEDFDRTLSERGVSDAKMIGQKLKEEGISPDVWLVSPAKRTFETAKIVQAALGQASCDFVSPELLYDAPAHHLRGLIYDYEKADCVCLVAHNPGVHQLVLDLLDEGATPRSIMDGFQSGYETGQATIFSFDAADRPIYETDFRPKALKARV